MVGRPRDHRATSDVLDATIAVIAEVGVARATVDAIAERAGVAKTTVYRRWATKYDLIVSALKHLDDSLDVPVTGDVVQDLTAVVRSAVGRFVDRPLGRMRLLVAAEAAVDPELRERMRLEGVLEARARRLMTDILATAADRGVLPPGFDIITAVDQISGAVVARTLANRNDFPDVFIAQLVHTSIGLTFPAPASVQGVMP